LETLAALWHCAGFAARRNARPAAGVFIFVLATLLSGCAGLVPQTKELSEEKTADIGLPEKTELTQVPFFPQDDYQCGPSALATTLAAYGAKVTPEDLVAQVYLPERKGSLQVEMLAAARRHGMVSYLIAPRFKDMLQEVAAGNPVIVLWNQAPLGSWHYAVAVGYDYEKGKLILRSGGTERQAVPFAIHELLWMRSGYWAMVAVPPGRIPATAVEPQWLSSVAALERVDLPAARVAYRTFLKRWPDNTNAEIGLANTYYALGDLTQAEGVLRAAAARDPGSEIVLNNLAQTLSDQNRNDEALPFIEKAAALRGPHAAAIEQTREAILGRIAANQKD
jgi:hypothetical protein